MAYFQSVPRRWALVLAGVALAGCAGEGSESIFTTGALGSAEPQPTPAPEAKVDPVCVTLMSRIDTLRKEGIADKIEKAAAKSYKMTPGRPGKADQLTKANAEFQVRCSTITPSRPRPAHPSRRTGAGEVGQAPAQKAAEPAPADAIASRGRGDVLAEALRAAAALRASADSIGLCVLLVARLRCCKVVTVPLRRLKSLPHCGS